jgi:hypothetical protein
LGTELPIDWGFEMTLGQELTLMFFAVAILAMIIDFLWGNRK